MQGPPILSLQQYSSCYMCSFDMVSHFICRCLSGRERAYTIHNYEVNIYASPSASLDSMTSGSNKVKMCMILDSWSDLP